MTASSSRHDLVDACVDLAVSVASMLDGAQGDRARDARGVVHAMILASLLLDEGLVLINGREMPARDAFQLEADQGAIAVTGAILEAMGAHGRAILPGGMDVHARVMSPPGTLETAARAIRALGRDGGPVPGSSCTVLAGWHWRFDPDPGDHPVAGPAVLQDVHARWLARTGHAPDAGQVYTPRAISGYLVDAATRDGGGGKAFRVLDPACGCGQVLVDAAGRMFDAIVAPRHAAGEPVDAPGIAAGLLRDAIHGMDVDELAIEVARLRLWAWFLSKARATTGSIRLPDLHGTVIHGNALLGDLPPGWNEFDAIAGNPPYVFVRGNLQAVKARLVSRYIDDPSCPPASITGRARQAGKVNLAGLFLMRAIDLLRPGGTLAMIVPNTLLRTTTAEVTRRFILAHATILEIVDLDAGAFEGVTASTIIISLRKGPASDGHAVVVKHAVSDLAGAKWITHEIGQASFHESVASAFTIHVEPAFTIMFTKASAGAFPLKSICKAIMEGLVTRRSDGLLVDDGTHPLARRLLRGRDIDRYAIRWPPDQHVIYDLARLHRPRPAWVHEAPVKLVAQRIGGGAFPLRVALDEGQHHVFASVNAIILKDDPVVDGTRYEYHYILGLLNSRFMNAYYLLHYSNKSRLTVNVGKTYLETLPVKPAPPDLQAVVGFLARCLVALQGIPEPGKPSDLVTFLDREVMDAIIFEHHVLDDARAPGSIFRAVQRAIENLPCTTPVETGEMLRERLLADPAFPTRVATVLGAGLGAIHALFDARRGGTGRL